MLLVLVEVGSVDVLVVCDVFTDVPLLLDVVEISSELWTSGVSLLECEVFPEILTVLVQYPQHMRGGEMLTFVEQLIDGCVTVDTCTWIAVPVPDTAGSRSLLVDLALVSELLESDIVSKGRRA